MEFVRKIVVIIIVQVFQGVLKANPLKYILIRFGKYVFQTFSFNKLVLLINILVKVDCLLNEILVCVFYLK